MKRDSIRVLGWRRVLKEKKKWIRQRNIIDIYRRLIENVGAEEGYIPIKDIKY